MARALRDYPEVSLRPEDLAGPVDFENIFGRKGPIHIEVGTGKAAFLLAEARAHPEIDFLGIEWARKYYRYSVDRIGRWGLGNVRIIRTEAATFVAQFVPDASVDCYHIYFPDPWPKKRHHKRRFLKAANFEHLLRTLKPGGVIRVATDHAEYFEQIRELFDSYSDKLQEIPFTPTAAAGDGQLTGTNYEIKYIRDSRQIFTLAAKKRLR